MAASLTTVFGNGERKHGLVLAGFVREEKRLKEGTVMQVEFPSPPAT